MQLMRRGKGDFARIHGFSGKFSSKSAVNLAWPEQIERTAADLIPRGPFNPDISRIHQVGGILVEYLANYQDR